MDIIVLDIESVPAADEFAAFKAMERSELDPSDRVRFVNRRIVAASTMRFSAAGERGQLRFRALKTFDAEHDDEASLLRKLLAELAHIGDDG